jgi:hypothetical protein
LIGRVVFEARAGLPVTGRGGAERAKSTPPDDFARRVVVFGLPIPFDVLPSVLTKLFFSSLTPENKLQQGILTEGKGLVQLTSL